MRESLGILVAALMVRLWGIYRAQSAEPRHWLRYQAIGVAAMLVSGAAGAILAPGWLRFAWLTLAVASAIALGLLPRQARRRLGPA